MLSVSLIEKTMKFQGFLGFKVAFSHVIMDSDDTELFSVSVC